ncbi:MAG: MauE/DoxX family redox-associated membrane protein [Actinomycetota bacterium]
MVFPVVASLLLVGAGVAKVVRPDPAVASMRSLGLPSSQALVRVGAGCEALLGSWSIATGSSWAVTLVTISYLAFAIFLAFARRSPDVASCGCFGQDGSPPTIRQIAVDLVVAVGCGIALLAESPPLRVLLHRSLFLGLMFSGIAVLGAWFFVLVLDPPVRAD